MMNPLQIIQMIRGGQNPQQQIVQALQNETENPVTQNLLTMIQQGDRQGIEQLARNLAKSQGKDFDKEFASFKKSLGF